MENKVLEINNLSKNYHDKNGEIKALESISFDVYDKEFVSIVGPSGCGKSTILSILAGISKKSGGNFLVRDNISIGYMLQDDSLFPWKTIYENCLVGLKITNKISKESLDYVDYLLKTYGLYEFKDKYPSSLSGGMKQRVALIRTLAIKPDILLLDEAMSALDYQNRLKISDDIYKAIKSEGKTAVMVTHDIAEVIFLINITFGVITYIVLWEVYNEK